MRKTKILILVLIKFKLTLFQFNIIISPITQIFKLFKYKIKKTKLKKKNIKQSRFREEKSMGLDCIQKQQKTLLLNKLKI
jgi:hypothetical protein